VKQWLKVGACFLAYYAFARAVFTCEEPKLVSWNGARAFLLMSTVALLFLAIIVIFVKPFNKQ
jgi:hypothetical protein